ncbi:hypothetical protein ACQUQU_06595 [Thalassolituus sp. LLYu03]|uniref:hypothetical protein n=1 Tax=Thalassolituus sp. LLYu03 TaxID=3421656 RepID=UPI003D2A81C9
MANILLKDNDEVLLTGAVSDLTPLGVECGVELEGLERLRNDAGKFRTLNIEIQLRSHGRNSTVCGTGNVYSVRRISQDRCMVNIRFISMEQNAVNLITEHAGPKQGVVCLSDVRTARQTKTA